MPKFLRIGVHQSNVSGYTSKAWCIRRTGSTVFLKWGAVEVRGVGDGRRVYWASPPRDKTIRCGTVQRAKVYATAAIARRRNHRYELLSGKIAIRRRIADNNAELEQTLATILFVDIVRSTEKAARLGDSRWTQVMAHYYATWSGGRAEGFARKRSRDDGGRTAGDVRHAGCRDPLREACDPRGGAHAGTRNQQQGGAARRRIPGERSRGDRSLHSTSARVSRR